jgi:hypothetical protein
MCEPYGRRFMSARNNNKASRFRSDIILLLYLPGEERSSSAAANVRYRHLAFSCAATCPLHIRMTNTSDLGSDRYAAFHKTTTLGY